ncbi:MAG: capsular exopolysaccharide synthesis family protein [Rhodothermales bacterium]|jgi:capsular exopolysaccharide synthesis family protein
MSDSLNGSESTGRSRSAFFERQPADSSLRDLVLTAWSEKWLGLAIFVVVMAAGIAYTITQQEVYNASSTILINDREGSTQVTAILGLRDSRRNVANRIEILRSRSIAMRVADALAVLENIPGGDIPLPILYDADGNRRPRLASAELIRRERLSVNQVTPDVDLISISIRSTSPAEAALIANVYAEEFEAYSEQSSRRRISASRAFLEEQADRFDSLLTKAESDLLAYAEGASVVDPEAEAQQLLDELAELNADRYRTDFERRAGEAQLEEFERQLNLIMPNLVDRLVQTDDVTIQQLRVRIAGLQVQIEERLSKNPELRDNPGGDRDLMQWRQLVTDFTSELRTRMSDYAGRIVASEGLGLEPNGEMAAVSRLQAAILDLRVRISAAEARIEVVQRNTREVESRLSRVPQRAVALARYNREMDLSANLSATIFQSLQEARIAEQSQLGYVELIDQAIVPVSPVSPRIPFNLLVTIVLAILLSVAGIVIRSASRTAVATPGELRAMGFSILGLIPNFARTISSEFGSSTSVSFAGRQVSTNLLSLIAPSVVAVERFRQVRTALRHMSQNGEVRSVLVTSAEAGDGKSTVAANLSIVLAQAGKRVLLVDADQRKPMQHKLHGLPRTPGLAGAVQSGVLPESEDLWSGADNLYVLAAGRPVRNPAELLASDGMRHLLEQAHERFDVIVIDSPPILAVTDAVILASMVDQVVITVSAGKTPRASVVHALDTLEEGGLTVAGIVVNKWDPRDIRQGGSAQGYGYGYGYGNGYGSSADSIYGYGATREH